MTTPESAIEAVKRAKAYKLFWDDVKVYGGVRETLRALDCQSTDEAIVMLSKVQTLSVFKKDGNVIIQ